MAIWDGIIPTEEEAFYRERGWGKDIGFGKRPALLIIDMNNAFVKPGSIFSSPHSINCAENIKKILDVARSAAIPVIHVTGHYRKTDALAGRGKISDKMKNEAMREDEGNQIYPLLAPLEGETVIYKYRPSAFFGTFLNSVLIYHSIDTLIITGTVTSGCIRATVTDAYSNNYRTIIPEECVCDRSRISHAVALFEIQMKTGDVKSVSKVINYLNSVMNV